ncbi:DUF2273 domain-containing protein [Paenibacillus sp. S150]|uniref:DUF2273 domain-containing protein n=1 Tax=Paenibacillus sp. S150 TaxID=2749826 RepID=UPI001C55A5EF|nr:DUF2273 domain-containing protein [Paenibacillus sp. S150]MBW4084564.1 DUF2273 domain-containing protein [Paenibacillus sp. S150]
MNEIRKWLYPYRGRISGLLLGLATAVFYLTIGWGPTLLLLVFASVGFLIGKWRDGLLDVKGWIRFIGRG